MLKWVKPLLIAVPAVTGAVLLLLVAGFALAPAETLVGALVGLVQRSAEVDIDYRSAQLERGLTTRLAFENLHVAAQDGSFSATSSDLQLSVDLPWLLLARLDFPLLVIGDTQVQVKTEPQEEASAGWSGLPVDLDVLRLRPVLHEVSLASLSVSAEGDQWKLPASTVSQLSLQLTPDTEAPELSADLEVVDETLHIVATLPDFKQSVGGGLLPFSLRINRPFATCSVQGKLDFTGADTRISAGLTVEADRLAELSPDGAVQVPGSLQLSGKLDGTFDRLPMSDIDGIWQAGDAGSGRLSGSIDNLIDMTGIAMQLDIKAAKPVWLDPALPDAMETMERVALSLKAGGSGERVELSGVELGAKTQDGLEIELSGTAELAAQADRGYELENIDADLAFRAPTTRAARALLFDDIPEFGVLQASTKVQSTVGHPTLSDVKVSTEHELGIKVRLGGAIDAFPLDADKPNTGYALDVDIQSPEADPVLALLDIDLPLAGPLDLAFRIEGKTPALQLNDIRLQAGTRKALSIRADGNLLFGDWSQQDPLTSMTFAISAYSHTTAALGRFSHTDALPELGPLDISGRVETLAGKHRVEAISLHTVKGARIPVSVTGNVASLVLFPSPSADGFELDFTASGEDITDLNALAGLDKGTIPPVGPFRIISRVTGSDRSLLIDHTSAEAGSKDTLRVKADGRLGRLDENTGWQFYDTDLKVAASATSSQAVVQAWGYQVPPLGPLNARAVINDKNRKPGLRDLSLSVGNDPAAPVLVATGHVADLMQGRVVDIRVKLDMDGHNLAAFADQHSLEDLAPVKGVLKITDSGGALGIASLQLNSDHKDLSIDISGGFPDFSRPQTLRLKSSIQARDLALLGALLDQHWPDYGPVDILANAGRDGQRLRFNTNVRAGKKGLDVDMHGDFTADPPKLAGKLTFHQLSLPDFFEEAARARKEREAQTKKDSKKGSKKKDKEQRLFSDAPIPFDYLKRIDLALSIIVDTFDPTDSEAVSAESSVRLKSGLLTFHPTVIHYPKGHLTIDAGIDARDHPKMHFKAWGTNIDPWLALTNRPAESNADFDADLDVDIDLSAAGETAHQIASSVDGDLYLTITNGKMRRSFTDLLFVDIVGWTANLVSNQKYLDLTCGVADFSASKGVIKTNGFFIDTRNIAITGDGTVDLGKEEVDYVFLPKKKSRLILKAEPVKLHGALADPSVSAVPVKSAALTFGTLIFAPYVFVGLTASDFLAGQLENSDTDAPCLKYERKHPHANPIE